MIARSAIGPRSDQAADAEQWRNADSANQQTSRRPHVYHSPVKQQRRQCRHVHKDGQGTHPTLPGLIHCFSFDKCTTVELSAKGSFSLSRACYQEENENCFYKNLKKSSSSRNSSCRCCWVTTGNCCCHTTATALLVHTQV